MTQLAKTSTPGIYRAHGNKCDGTGRCDCPYVITWRHRGRQHKETCRTFNEAREKKSLRDSVDSKPIERTRLSDYFPNWIETYAGRTQRGFSETTRPEYRRTIENNALPRWKTLKLSEIEPKDVRELHTFRHTCASLLFANGKDIKQIQTWLGHADAGFTLRTYVHLLEEGVGSADFLDDAMEVGRGPWSEEPGEA